MKVNIQIEGQRGLNWARWQRIVPAVEDFGFDGLFRSDHLIDANLRDRDSLDLWTSLTWLAANTKRMEFGPLVSPVSFRHPVHTARMARDIDDLSGGRFVLGVGAGWGGGTLEHEMFGFDLLDLKGRFARWQEGLQVITQLLRNDGPVSFQGKYFRLRDAYILPRPRRPGGPPILIGGNGPRKVLEVAAQYGDEWNAIFRSPAQFRQLNAELDDLLAKRGRDPRTVRRSQMKGLVFGRDEIELGEALRARQATDSRSKEELFSWGMLVGTPPEIVDQLGACSEAGMEGVMIQWADLDDLAGLEAFAKLVLPQVQSMELQRA